jgi:replicative DNA helicase
MAERIELSHPIHDGGDTIDALELDFESLTQRDLEVAQMLAEEIAKKPILMPDTSKIYHRCVAAKAAGKAPEVLAKLKADDATSVTMAAVNFLLSGEG